MLRIVHGSDIHFGKPHDPQAAAAFVRAIGGLAPDVVVLSGDLTQRAKVHEYEAAAEFIRQLPEPVIVTPGNHDVPLYRVFERLFAPHRNYRRHIRDELDTVTHVRGATFVALDSSAPHTAIVNGRLSRAQLEFARRAFAAAPSEDLRILVTHHPLATAPDYRSDPPLPGRTQVLSELESMGVELVLGGHLHRAYTASSLDVYPHPAPARGLWIVHSGTTTSTRGRVRERGKNSFNVVDVSEEHMVAEHYIYCRQADGFESFARHAVPRLREADPR